MTSTPRRCSGPRRSEQSSPVCRPGRRGATAIKCTLLVLSWAKFWAFSCSGPWIKEDLVVRTARGGSGGGNGRPLKPLRHSKKGEAVFTATPTINSHNYPIKALKIGRQFEVSGLSPGAPLTAQPNRGKIISTNVSTNYHINDN